MSEITNGIKRVLWIDDRPDNQASDLFIENETKNVSTMDEAIKEIVGEHLYEYDTIVLDIDFRDGVRDANYVIPELSKKIYLSEEQKNNEFIIKNGGYLLFLYLLEKGYPSSQVAFLTGNVGIIDELKRYHQQTNKPMTKEEIIEAFLQAWEEIGDNSEDIDPFIERIDKLPISSRYKNDDFILDCAEKLEDGDINGFKKMVMDVVPQDETTSQNVKNTVETMIYRFHEANLETPVYFSKNKNDITEHNREDAGKWLESNRTDKRVLRWLILFVANAVERFYRSNQINELQIKDILKTDNISGDIRNAFRQMFFVFNSLSNGDYKNGVYYQTISSMLIPFDDTPKFSGDSVNDSSSGLNDELKIRRMCTCCSKQARNYCAHNYFGVSVSENTILFLLLITITAIWNKEQRKQMNVWYKKAAQLFDKWLGREEDSVDPDSKIDAIIASLIAAQEIDLFKAKVDENYQDYTPRQLLYALGYNNQMNRAAETSNTKREHYFVFTLAAYIVKWFDGLTKEEAKARFGEEVTILYDIALRIVKSYTYPN